MRYVPMTAVSVGTVTPTALVPATWISRTGVRGYSVMPGSDIYITSESTMTAAGTPWLYPANVRADFPGNQILYALAASVTATAKVGSVEGAQ